MEQVGIAQAARILGISQDTIRRRLKTGQLAGEKIQSAGGFRWLVEIPDPSQETTASNSQGETQALRDLANALQEQLNARTREISELHQLLAARALEGPRNRPRSWWTFWRR